MMSNVDINKAIEIANKLKELMTRAEIILQIVEGLASEIDDVKLKHAFAHALIKEILATLRFTSFETYGLLETIKFEDFYELIEERKVIDEQIRRGKYKL